MIEQFLIPVFIISILIALNGIFVAAEFSIVSVPRTRIAQRANKGSSIAKRILGILNDPILQNQYIATSQVGITIVSLGLGMYGEQLLATWFLQFLAIFGDIAEVLAHSIAFIFAVGILTFLHVVIGEMIPKTIALQNAENTVIYLDPLMATLGKIFYPIVQILNFLGDLITRLFGIPPASKQSRLLTPGEIEFIVEESAEKGILTESDRLFIENILDLQYRTAEHAMTPRNRVLGLPISMDPRSAFEFICSHNKTRYPLFEENIDQIQGILHIKDIARMMLKGYDNKFSLRDIARSTIFVPETTPLDKLFFELQKNNQPFAIVMDEFGGTSGIITMEDLIEEVMGEIQDEYDHEIKPVERLSASLIRARGDLILDELNQLYGLHLFHAEAKTIGGLLMAHLGRIPVLNDEIEIQDVKMQVEGIKGMAVQSVLIHLPD